MVANETGAKPHLDLYEYAVEHPGWEIEDAANELGLPRDEVKTARDTLVRMGLLQPIGGSPSPQAVSPEVALADRVHDDQATIEELTRTVETVRAELAQVAPVYAAARHRRNQRETALELVEEPEAVRRLIRSSTSDCQIRAYILHPNVSLRAESHRASDAYDRQLLERGVDRRNIYHEGALANAATRRSVAELAPLGVKFRTIPVVPVQALIYDENLAIISRRATADDKAAIVIRDPGLISVVRLVYETLWDLATPFPVEGTAPVAPDESGQPNDLEIKILQALAAGHTDESISRRLGFHVRTLRRHIGTLSDLLGADSRFQLALLARERDWI